MLVDLDRKALETLAQGSEPNYDIFENPLIKRAGGYHGGFRDEWFWFGWKRFTDEELIQIYELCRDSWKTKE